jgi:uncharacterized protein (TIGR02466 family)
MTSVQLLDNALSMPAHECFSTHILHESLFKPMSRLLNELQSDVLLLQKKDTEGLKWSAKNYACGYTSYGSLDQLHKMTQSFASLEKKLQPVLKQFILHTSLDLNSKDLFLSRMWANVMGQGAHHGMHLHPLSVISGTVYVSCPKNSAALVFEDPRLGLFMNRPALKEKASRRQKNFLKATPKAGDVILFESWLRHEVPTHVQKENRISISFNFDLRG